MSSAIENTTGLHLKPGIIATVFFITVFCVLFSMSGCSSLSVARANSLPPTPLATADATSRITNHSDTLPGNDADDSFTIDKVTDDWEKQRAIYLRSLDYAQIERQADQHDIDHNDYLLKGNLIESRYQIKDAEAAMYIEHDYPKALAELQTAKQRFDQAMKDATPLEANELEAAESNLDDLIKTAQLAVKWDRTYPQASRYRQVEANIEDLIAN